MDTPGKRNFEALIEGCIEGDRHSQEMLYREFAPRMYPVCISYSSNSDVAKEIMQDGFYKMFKKINTFKSDGSFEGWLRRIIVNTAIDYARKRDELQYAKEIEEAESTFNVSNEALSNIGEQELLTLTQKLPSGAKAVFNLYALEGFNHHEIAQKLSISVGTSKSQFSRARTLLQGWVEELYG